MNYVLWALRESPELALFLTLAVGFAIGRVKVGSFTLGNVVGTLLAGVVIGQVGVAVPPLVKTVFFDLFLFATGYKVGPQFFRGLKKNAATEVTLTIVLCVTSLATTILAAKLLGYDVGTAAGLMAGAFTESTVIGTAGEAIGRLNLPDAEKARLLNNIPVAYSVSYLVGTGFVVWYLSSLAPRLLRINLKQESRALAATMNVQTSDEKAISAYRPWDIRPFLLPEAWTNQRVADVEGRFSQDRLFIPRIRRGNQLIDPEPATILERGDVVAIAARRHVWSANQALFGAEMDDRELLDFPMAALDVVLTNRQLADHTIGELAAEHGRGVTLMKLTRGGEEMPFTPAVVLNRGDVLTLGGAARDVERAGRALGYIDRPSRETDMVFVGLGIFLGGLVGLLSVPVAGVPLSLTASGGALIMGLVFGWLRSVRPTFGRIPEPALWVFDTIGLATFIGVVGLSAGPTFVAGIRETGPSLLIAAFFVAVIPHTAALLVGRYVLKMNPVLLLGACAGAGTVTAALRSIQDEAQSNLPVLGYTVPYAIGNILLTAWGPVIVVLMQ